MSLKFQSHAETVARTLKQNWKNLQIEKDKQNKKTIYHRMVLHNSFSGNSENFN